VVLSPGVSRRGAVRPVAEPRANLVVSVLDTAWNDGGGLTLPDLTRLIQNPPVKRVGVFDLEPFYPSKERFGLAMALHNLLASPGFESWITGEPVHLDHLLHARR
jgi:hypothetical protein